MKVKVVEMNTIYKVVEVRSGALVTYSWASIDGRYYSANTFETVDKARANAEVNKSNVLKYLLSAMKSIKEDAKDNNPDNFNYILYGEYLQRFAQNILLKENDWDETHTSPMNFEEWEEQVRKDPDSMLDFYEGNIPHLA